MSLSTHKITIDAYNKNAAAYHAHVSNPEESAYHSYYEKPAIRALLPDVAGLSVLSIGCGSGLDARYLKDSGAAQVTGVDISEGLIEIAKKENQDIDFQVMDMEKLDFPDESFGLCYSSLAIQ